jgi:hypothetical protein
VLCVDSRVNAMSQGAGHAIYGVVARARRSGRSTSPYLQPVPGKEWASSGSETVGSDTVRPGSAVGMGRR